MVSQETHERDETEEEGERRKLERDVETRETKG